MISVSIGFSIPDRQEIPLGARLMGPHCPEARYRAKWGIPVSSAGFGRAADWPGKFASRTAQLRDLVMSAKRIWPTRTGLTFAARELGIDRPPGPCCTLRHCAERYLRPLK